MSTPGDIRDELLAGNAEYQRLAEQHSHYQAELEKILHSEFHSSEDLVQEIELKKLRLQVKDQMERMCAETRRKVAHAGAMAAASR